MKGFIPRTVLSLGLCLTGLAGCACYRDIVDPCWPERYNYLARASVNEANNAQAYNGHVLDQTIWNYHFEHDPKTGAPTDRLNPAGIEHLRYLSRRRPVPDARLYLATAQDLPGLATMPAEGILKMRSELDSRRIASIQEFLTSQTSGHIPFTVEVHDPAEVGIAALQITGSMPPVLPRPVVGGYQKFQDSFQGVLPLQSGTSAGGAGAGAGGGGAGGGAPGGPR
jgi:hypothetical protein